MLITSRDACCLSCLLLFGGRNLTQSEDAPASKEAAGGGCAWQNTNARMETGYRVGKPGCHVNRLALDREWWVTICCLS